MITTAVAETLGNVQETSRRDRFHRVIVQYGPALRRLAHAYLDHELDREDLIQDIAVALWTALPRFRGDSSERTWLYRIAHNVAITAAAKSARRGTHEQAPPEVFEPLSAAPSSEHQLLDRERRQTLFDAVRALPPVDRQLVVLHLEGLSHAEIEGVTGRSEGAIATRLSRVRARLRAELQKKGVTHP
jgi:RNA polymerase sigma-70 factor (ECF subfamily)